MCKGIRKIKGIFIGGFTLVEVLLVVAIIGIIASVSWVTLVGAKKNSDVLNSCEQVASMINKTRNYVLSGRVAISTVTINGNFVSINSPIENFTIPNGVNCTAKAFTYKAPDAVDVLNTGEIICSNGGNSRKVTVTPYQAVCD